MRSIVKYTFVVLVVFLAGCAGTEEYKTAQRHLGSAEYAPALNAFERALKKNPDFTKDKAFQEKLLAAKRGRARQLLRKSLSAADTGTKLGVVKRDIEKAARLDPKNRQVKNALKSIVEPESDSAGKVYAKGIAYYNKKDWHKAEGCFARAIKIRAEHIPARIKRLESATKVDKADNKYRLGIELRDKKKLTSAAAALKESLAISPFHPKAGEVLEAVENTKTEAENLYRKGKESAKEADWNDAEKSFAAAIDIWSDYNEAKQGLTEVCLKQVDNYERQGLPGHALIKCVRALETMGDNRIVRQRSETLRDRLLDSISCQVGLLVTDAGGDGRKAGKVEGAILSVGQQYWPSFLKLSTREEMKIGGISPEYLIFCKVLELDAATETFVEPKSERVKVGTKNVPNPDYFAAKEKYEKTKSQEEYYSNQGSCLGALASGLSRLSAEMALDNTSMYLEEDVYETRHYTVTTYHHSASISLNTRITEPATGVLVDSLILSDSDLDVSDKKYGVDLLSPITKNCCEQICRKVASKLSKARAQKFLNIARQSFERGDKNSAIEHCAKSLLISPDQVSEVIHKTNQVIGKGAESKDFAIFLAQWGLTSTVQN